MATMKQVSQSEYDAMKKAYALNDEQMRTVLKIEPMGKSGNWANGDNIEKPAPKTDSSTPTQELHPTPTQTFTSNTPQPPRAPGINFTTSSQQAETTSSFATPEGMPTFDIPVETPMFSAPEIPPAFTMPTTEQQVTTDKPQATPTFAPTPTQNTEAQSIKKSQESDTFAPTIEQQTPSNNSKDEMFKSGTKKLISIIASEQQMYQDADFTR